MANDVDSICSLRLTAKNTTPGGTVFPTCLAAINFKLPLLEKEPKEHLLKRGRLRRDARVFTVMEPATDKSRRATRLRALFPQMVPCSPDDVQHLNASLLLDEGTASASACQPIMKYLDYWRLCASMRPKKREWRYLKSRD